MVKYSKKYIKSVQQCGSGKKRNKPISHLTTKLNNSGQKTTNVPDIDELMERFRALQTNNNGDIPNMDELMARFRALQTDDAEGPPYREGGKTRKRKTRKRKTRKRKTKRK